MIMGVASLVTLATLLSLSLPVGAVDPMPAPPVHRVAIVFQQTPKLLTELNGELQSSSLSVVVFKHGGGGLAEVVPDLRQAEVFDGVLLDPDENHVVVFSLPPGGSDVVIRGTYAIDKTNRLARRRLWLALVEQLRHPPERVRLADGQDKQIQLVPATETPATGDRAPHPPATTPPAAWMTGAASSVRISGHSIGIASHLMVTGVRTGRSRFEIVVTGLWPVLAAHLDKEHAQIRIWTFLAMLGFQLRLGSPGSRVQPFVGISVGGELCLTDTYRSGSRLTNVAQTFSSVLEAVGGVRLTLSPRLAVLFQLHMGDAQPWAQDRTRQDIEAADAPFASGAAGLLFNF